MTKNIAQAKEARDKLQASLDKKHADLQSTVKIIFHKRHLALQVVFPKNVNLMNRQLTKEYLGFVVLSKTE